MIWILTVWLLISGSGVEGKIVEEVHAFSTVEECHAFFEKEIKPEVEELVGVIVVPSNKDSFEVKGYSYSCVPEEVGEN